MFADYLLTLDWHPTDSFVGMETVLLLIFDAVFRQAYLPTTVQIYLKFDIDIHIFFHNLVIIMIEISDCDK